MQLRRIAKARGDDHAAIGQPVHESGRARLQPAGKPLRIRPDHGWECRRRSGCPVRHDRLPHCWASSSGASSRRPVRERSVAMCFMHPILGQLPHQAAPRGVKMPPSRMNTFNAFRIHEAPRPPRDAVAGPAVAWRGDHPRALVGHQLQGCAGRHRQGPHPAPVSAGGRRGSRRHRGEFHAMRRSPQASRCWSRAAAFPKLAMVATREYAACRPRLW